MLLHNLFLTIVSSYVYFFAQALATMQWDWSKKWPDLNIDVDQCIFLKVGNKELWCWQNCKEYLWKKISFLFSSSISLPIVLIHLISVHTSQKRWQSTSRITKYTAVSLKWVPFLFWMNVKTRTTLEWLWPYFVLTDSQIKYDLLESSHSQKSVVTSYR